MARRLVIAVVVAVFAVGLVAYLYTRAGTRRSGTLSVPTSSDPQLIKELAIIEQPPAYFQTSTRRGEPARDRPRDSYRDGMEKYGQKDYLAAIPFLEQAVARQPGHHPAIFYLGVSYLLTERFDDCIRELSKLVGPSSTAYTEESHWYMAKAHLRKLDVSSARGELESVVAINGVYVNDARKSLKLMEGIDRGSK